MTTGIGISDPAIGEAERQAVLRVLESGQLAQGEEVAAFEAEIASTLSGTRHAVAVSSGTAALELAVEALGIRSGDVVVTSPFTFAATVNSILRAGATVRFADICDDFTLDPRAVEAALADGARLIVPVHLYGLPADMEALSAFGVPQLEDACQAHLAMLGGARAGALGVAGCFSFYATKNMTCGEGGAITTDDGDLAAHLRVLRNQGMANRYEFEAVGTNARMTDLQAAIGRVQLAALPARTEARRVVASRLTAGLAHLETVHLPTVPAGRTHVWHQYTIELDPCLDRDTVVARMRDAGIGVGVYYPRILSDYRVYRDHPAVDASARLDRARRAAASVLSLPVHPRVTEDDVARIAEALEKAVR